MLQLQNPEVHGPSEPFRQTWDASFVTGNPRFGDVRGGVSQALLPFTPEDWPDCGSDARIDTADLGEGLISKIAVTPYRVVRIQTDLATISGEYLSLGLQLSGGLTGDLNGKPFSQKAGDISLISANRIKSFELDPGDRYAAIALLFEPSRLYDLPDLDHLYVLSSAYLQPIKMCLFLINERYDSASKSHLTHLFEATLALLQAALVQDRDVLQDRCLHDPAIRNGLLQAMQAFIGKSIADPGLSTISVARHFGISTRYAQKLCADAGITLKSLITATRLDKVQVDLFDPSIAHVAVCDIAFRWGFRDMTTFHRTFKLRFGDTPNQMRARPQNTRVLSPAA